MTEQLDRWFATMPVIAILRGVRPEDVVEIGEAVYKAGIGRTQVPVKCKMIGVRNGFLKIQKSLSVL